MKTTRQIRKELAKLIELRHQSCITQQEKNKAINDARSEINKKYGNDWRHIDDKAKAESKFREPSIYDDHTFGEHWMD